METSRKVIGKRTYVENDELDLMAKKVIESEGLDTADAVIKCMIVYPYVSKTVAGRCIRSTNELRYFSECDFIIQMSGDLWDNLNDKTREVLMHHELLHVGYTLDKEGNVKYTIVKHDIEDFSVIVDKYGLDWFHTLRDEAVKLDPKIDPKSIKL